MGIFLDWILLNQGVAHSITSDCSPHGQICDSEAITHDKAPQSEVLVQLVEKIAQSLDVHHKEAFTSLDPFLNLFSNVQQIFCDRVTRNEQKLHARG